MAKKNHKRVHYAAAVIFVLVALIHLWRVLYQVPAKLGEWNIPVWLSWIGFIIALALAAWLWKSAE